MGSLGALRCSRPAYLCTGTRSGESCNTSPVAEASRAFRLCLQVAAGDEKLRAKKKTPRAPTGARGREERRDELPAQAEGKLHIAHGVRNTDNFACRAGINCTIHEGREVGTVEEVKVLPAELQFGSLGDLEVLEKRPVGDGHARGTEGVLGGVTEPVNTCDATWGRKSVGSRIEPAITTGV